MSDLSYEGTPDWMKHVTVFMPDDVMMTGNYTGYMAVETGETLWSRFVDRERHERFDRCEGISIIYMTGEQFFDKEKCDADRGYLTMHMWEDGHLRAPSCYHTSCWKAVGSPVGYRGPSIHSQDQGFGSAAKMYGVENYGCYDEDRDEGPYITEPTPGPEAIMLWAVNSVCHFFYTLHSWAMAIDHAEKQRDMWKRLEEMDELLKRTDALIGENDDEENPSDCGTRLRAD